MGKSTKIDFFNTVLTWLSSLLIGLFFITESGDGSSLQYLEANKLYIDWMLTTLAILGVKLLSFLDVKVYHPQLGAIFSEQLALEKACPNLEKEYLGMARLLHSKHFDPIVSDSLYYSIIMIIIAFLGVFSLYLKVSETNNPMIISILFLAFFIFIICEIISVSRSIFWGISREGQPNKSIFRGVKTLFRFKRSSKKKKRR